MCVLVCVSILMILVWFVVITDWLPLVLGSRIPHYCYHRRHAQ